MRTLDTLLLSHTSQSFHVPVHDLALIFEKAFGIHPKQLDKDSKFLVPAKRYGWNCRKKNTGLDWIESNTTIRAAAQWMKGNDMS